MIDVLCTCGSLINQDSETESYISYICNHKISYCQIIFNKRTNKIDFYYLRFRDSNGKLLMIARSYGKETTVEFPYMMNVDSIKHSFIDLDSSDMKSRFEKFLKLIIFS